MTIKEQMEALKELRIKEILEDTTTTKVEKLSLLEDEKLFEYATYIQDEFKEWESELEKQVLATGKQWAFNDSIFAPCKTEFEKYSSVEYSYLLSDYLDDLLEDEDSDDNLIDVITSRSSDLKITKTKEEIIDVVFDYAIANKIIGFKNDW